ncbi:hypothetical protein N9033_00515 [bacterium]|nr:hypothetical protein [bacterium]MDB4464533.1 hypothetical protein [bacterium]|tara:strand:- start:107 stop:400 length:294 start_codon:yes stop_codon:yes gene_type:complete
MTVKITKPAVNLREELSSLRNQVRVEERTFYLTPVGSKYTLPYGYTVQDVYIDGELAREGASHDYQVQTDGTSIWVLVSVAPSGSTVNAIIGVRNGS